MQSFEWIDALTIEQAAALLAAPHPHGPVVAKAGGMDLLDLMKEGILAPARIVNLTTIDELRGITYDATQGLTVRALNTLAELASDARVITHYPALALACAHAATPQVRNAATIGGNLLQRPRCWYFRHRHFHIARQDTRRDAAQYGAIFDNDETVMVHASTPATALIAYGAMVHLRRAEGQSRSVRLEDFLRSPDMGRASDTLIEPGEVLTHLSIPALPAGTRAAYHKHTERDSYDWPLCDVAVVLRMEGGTVAAASILLGWVAPTPRRAVNSEKALLGHELTEERAARAAHVAVQAATPLPENRYKVPILQATVRRTILATLSRGAQATGLAGTATP